MSDTTDAACTWSDVAQLVLAVQARKALSGELSTAEALMVIETIQGRTSRLNQPFPLDIARTLHQRSL